ncbi:MAG TPA: NAD(P)/FAD-dependent oxidoreductase [Micromonosporaceae bacterium]
MRTAVVVGAGVGGLAAAGALARTGWQVTLIERGDRLRGSGAGLLLWPNGQAALRSLGVSLGDIAFAVAEGGIRRNDGRWLVEADRGGVEPADPAAVLVVHGDDLHDALMAALGERIDVRTGTEVTTVRANAGLRPAVGTGRQTFEADLIVAADGSHSLIRRRLAPQSALVPAGHCAWRGVVPWYRAPKLPDTEPASGELLGAGLRFQYAMLGQRGNSGGSSRGGIAWVAIVPGAPRPESAQTQLRLLRRWFSGWHSPVPDLLGAAEPEDLVQHAVEELRPLPRRFGQEVGSGGVVLLGDAAHVATPNLAQGACLAFEDAATLGALVGMAQPGPELARALNGYTLARRARVARVARASRRLGSLLLAQGRLSVQARDVALGRLPGRLLHRSATSAYQWTPPGPAAPR